MRLRNYILSYLLIHCIISFLRDPMKTFLLIIVLLVLAVCVFFFILGSKSKSGVAAGLIENQLSQCGSKPNCVCSEQQDRGEHYVEPVKLVQPNVVSLQQVSEVITAAGGEVVQSSDNYLAATFTSSAFGFVDDFEARLDADKGVLHLRSASRVGHSDLGANRKRVEQIRTALQAL